MLKCGGVYLTFTSTVYNFRVTSLVLKVVLMHLSHNEINDCITNHKQTRIMVKFAQPLS